VDDWYAGPLWGALRASPAFPRVVAARARYAAGREAALAAALAAFSPGVVPPGRPAADLPAGCLFVAGSDDARAVAAARAHAASAPGGAAAVVVEGAGHAVPAEAPLALARAVWGWLEGGIDG
jgi:hypothetical protein